MKQSLFPQEYNPTIWDRTKEIGSATFRLAMRNPKIAAFATAYVLSPLDIIPEPVLPCGVMDDLAIIAAGTYAVFREVRNNRQARQAEAASSAQSYLAQNGQFHSF